MNVHISTELIIKEARRRKLKAEFIGRDQNPDIYFLESGGKRTYFDRSLSDLTAPTAITICKDKSLAKILLQNAGVSTPKGRKFYSHELEKGVKFARTLNWPLVLKPANGSLGKKVFANITNIEQFNYAWNEITGEYTEVILEEKIEGEEYRIFATRDKAFSVVKRVPAYVVGDGKHTIKQLVDIKNKKLRSRIKEGAFKEIAIDFLVKINLEEIGMTENYVPSKDQIVYLRHNSNIATGGESVDCAELADESVKKIAVMAVNAIPGLAYAGVDLITKDISAKQNDGSYSIIEMNHRPDLYVNTLPLVGQGTNVASDIIDLAFPETKRLYSK